VSGLREKIAEAIHSTCYEGVRGYDSHLEADRASADAVLRVLALAEHGDTQRLRTELGNAIWGAPQPGAILDAVMAVVAPAIARARYLNAQDRVRLYEQLERAEADLAAAKQQLDQVRALAEANLYAVSSHALLAILDAPGRTEVSEVNPAGHDENKQDT